MSFWSGALKTLVDLFGADSPGGQPYGVPVAYNGFNGATPNPNLVLGIVAASALPARPPTNAIPTIFFAQPSGNLGAGTTYICQVPGSTTPAAGQYYPGDIIRLFFKPTQLGTVSPVIYSVSVATTLATVNYATAVSFAYVDIQLNAAGTAWTAIGGGYT